MPILLPSVINITIFKQGRTEKNPNRIEEKRREKRAELKELMGSDFWVGKETVVPAIK